jgi:hypothetical protein
MFIRSKIMGNREDYEKKLEVITEIGKGLLGMENAIYKLKNKYFYIILSP